MDSNSIKSTEHCMMFLATFARSYYTFYAIDEHLNSLDDNTGNLFPFRSICNALLCDAAIIWCKVFGSNKEKTHWKLTVDNQDEFRSFLFSELGITQKEFNLYWKDITEFRSNIVAHFNPEYFETGETPSFDIAMQSAAAVHKYLRKQFQSNIQYTGPLCLDEYGKATARAVMSKLHV
ncbi:hypothetical protein AEBE7430_19345 [Aeromonas bestiarum]